MKIYVFIGTHLPEIASCMERLAADPGIEGTVSAWWPEGLPGVTPPFKAIAVQTYQAEDAAWVFDPDQTGTVFVLLDPQSDLILQIEDLAEDLRKCLIEPVKVITCVDCHRAESSPQLRQWLDAAIYYSDVVLLGNRVEASKPFVRDYETGYRKRCYPCHFFLLKGPGQPTEVPEILCEGPRRLSQIFDIPDNSEEPMGPVIESSFDLDLEEPEEDPFRPAEDGDGPTPPTIPDVRSFIVGLEPA